MHGNRELISGRMRIVEGVYGRIVSIVSIISSESSDRFFDRWGGEIRQRNIEHQII